MIFFKLTKIDFFLYKLNETRDAQAGNSAQVLGTLKHLRRSNDG